MTFFRAIADIERPSTVNDRSCRTLRVSGLRVYCRSDWHCVVMPSLYVSRNRHNTNRTADVKESIVTPFARQNAAGTRAARILNRGNRATRHFQNRSSERSGMTPTPLRAAGEIDRSATNLADVPISMRRHVSLIYVGFCRWRISQ